MDSEHIDVPSLNITLSYKPKSDLLGSGTVGEVFKVTVIKPRRGFAPAKGRSLQTYFALKRFLCQQGRDDFDNERRISRALESLSHPHILTSTFSWVDKTGSYMLFELADGDLYNLFRNCVHTLPTKPSVSCFLQQVRGLCDAIRCLHNYEGEIRDYGQRPEAIEIGFHHDLKPANVVIFAPSPLDTVWKLCDFGSGAIETVESSAVSIYNRKASTGDPVYSAPEYIRDGRVSRPKDIWSLGCILLEALTWLIEGSSDAVQSFEAARREANIGTTQEGEAVFWNEANVTSYKQSSVSLNNAVLRQLDLVRGKCEGSDALIAFHRLVDSMLEVDPMRRPKASHLCDQLGEVMQCT